MSNRLKDMDVKNGDIVRCTFGNYPFHMGSFYQILVTEKETYVLRRGDRVRISTLNIPRFEKYSRTWKLGDRIVCIVGGTQFQRGKVYEVIEEEYGVIGVQGVHDFVPLTEMMNVPFVKQEVKPKPKNPTYRLTVKVIFAEKEVVKLYEELTWTQAMVDVGKINRAAAVFDGRVVDVLIEEE